MLIVCGGNISGNRGVITSPNFPGKYVSNLDCQWVINVSSGKIVRVTIETMVLEDNQCKNDYLLLVDGSPMSDTIIASLCGNRRNTIHYSTSSHMTLQFKTNNALNTEGFQLHWEAVDFGTTGKVDVKLLLC